MSDTFVRQALRSWRIFCKSGTYFTFIGIVDAPNQATAIDNAIRRYKIIDVEQQRRLVAEHRSR
jgi:hypothetical protein